ncbi:DAK2 domain-containing protein [Promicromonospora sukumoe]|uniref:DAK2 domain-containing protein n=1 Tax=Promicromonospora sukumoe TaxID=88382 RepID=UPI00037485C4|nr:DAK2 domain-containing protein [Promicromonospora sukumoe]
MTDVHSGSRTADSGPQSYPEAVRLDDPGLVRAWTQGATAALRRERGAIDRVNVFPVADADTGTNLYLTLREGDRAVAAAPADATGPQLLATLARAALLGARGNSGVILSEWLRGLAVAARRGGTAADLLTRAAASARSAVAVPAEGTILTAADAAGAAARTARSGADAGVDAGVLPVVTAAAAAARASARASRDELDVLRTAGVLDAGALGLVLVLDALVVAAEQAADPGSETGSDAGADADPGTGPGGVSVVRGSMEAVNLDQLLDAGALPSAPDAADPAHPATSSASPAPDPASGTAEPAGLASHDAGSGGLELMFVLTGPAGEASETVAAGLRASLAEVGDSVVVVGGDSGADAAVWQAHVHTDHLDQALAIAAEVSRARTLAQVHVRHLAAAGQDEWGVVAVTSAPGLAAELAHTGAVVLLSGGLGSTVEPLTPDDVGRAAASTGARRVLILGAPDVTAGIEQPLDVDELITVPAATDVHAVVALAALGTLLPLGLPDDVGVPDPVDARALVGEALAGLTVRAVPGADAVGALRESGGPGTTVVTALLDADVPADLADRLAAVLGEQAPDAELVLLATGRPGDGVHLGTETDVPEVDA